MGRGFVLDGYGWSRPMSGGADSVVVYDARARQVLRDGVVIGDDIFEALGRVVEEDPDATWVGYLGYACRTDLQARPAVGFPDAVWMRVAGSAVPDEQITAAATAGSTEPYDLAFAEVQRRLRAGDSYEVNLTRRVALGSSVLSPQQVYERLQAMNPAPYAAHLWSDGTHVLSASPESFAEIADGRIRTKPIKGTAPRDPDPTTDQRNAEHLRSDPRYRAENLMITDLMRNDLAQVCVPGTVEVTGLMQVESYPAVHQLVSTVEGELNASTSIVDALRALFPAGSMTGAPKRRTMEIIDAVESTPRGIYSGVLGWMSGGACELSVVIRSLIRDTSGAWHAGTGGGITVHSDAASEWAESEWKLNRLREALAP